MRLMLSILFSLSTQVVISQSGPKPAGDEEKLRQWVRNNKLITLDDDTLLVNGIYTNSLETVVANDRFVSVKIPTTYDSMVLVLGRYNGPGALIPVAQQPCKDNETSFDVLSLFTGADTQSKVGALFIHAFSHGTRRKLFCRIIIQEPGSKN